MSSYFFKMNLCLIVLSGWVGFLLCSTAMAEDKSTTLSDIIVTDKSVDTRTLKLDEKAQTGSHLGLKIKDTPASIEVVDENTMKARGDRTVLEAAEKMTGFTGEHNPGTPGSFSVRGFEGNSVAWLYNGIRIPGGSGMSARGIDTANIERIEVLRGPASVLYGEGAIGAAVNLITRSPSFDEQPLEIDYAYSSFDSYRFHLGGGGILKEDLAACRVDVSTNRYGSDVDDERNNLDRINASVLIQPTDTIALTLELDRMEDEAENIYYGTPLVNGEISESLREINYNNLTDNVYGSDTTWLRANLEWKPTVNWKVSNQLYSYDSYREWRNVEYYTYNGGANPTVTREWWGDLDHDHQVLGNRLDVLNTANVFGFNNRFLVGADISHVDFQTKRNGFPGSDEVDAVNPPEVDFISVAGVYRSLARDVEIDQWSLFAEDQFAITDGLKLVGGVRFDSFDTRWIYYDQDGYPEENKAHEFTTWRLGVVYDLIKNLTLYGAYATAVEPGGTLLLLNREKSQLDLTEASQIEIGLKQMLWDDRAMWTVAVYDITKENLFVSDPDSPSNLLPVGQQSSKGVEFSVGIKPAAQFQIDANIAVVDAEYDDYSTGNPPVSYAGNTPPFVPKWVANLGLSYLPTEDLRFNAWLRHVDSVFIDDANTIELPDYTTLDLSADYKLTSSTDIGFRVRNVTDEVYAQSSYYGQVLLADPRTYEVSLSVRY